MTPEPQPLSMEQWEHYYTVLDDRELLAKVRATVQALETARQELADMLAELSSLKAQLDAAHAGAAALREALERADGSHLHEPTCSGNNESYNGPKGPARCYHCNADLEALRLVRAALASDAGRGYVSREVVEKVLADLARQAHDEDQCGDRGDYRFARLLESIDAALALLRER